MKVIGHSSFYDWKDYKSSQKFLRQNRVLLKDIVCIKVKIEKFTLHYKIKLTYILPQNPKLYLTNLNVNND